MKLEQALKEAGKEFARIVVASLVVVIPTVIFQLESTGRVSLMPILTVGAVAALKAIDKLIHKWDGIDEKGLLPF